jgi:hypothetical protein
MLFYVWSLTLTLIAVLSSDVYADEKLLHSVRNGELEQVREHLKELGKDPNHQDPWEKSVLMHSAYKGHYDIAYVLYIKYFLLMLSRHVRLKTHLKP